MFVFALERVKKRLLEDLTTVLRMEWNALEHLPRQEHWAFGLGLKYNETKLVRNERKKIVFNKMLEKQNNVLLTTHISRSTIRPS